MWFQLTTGKGLQHSVKPGLVISATICLVNIINLYLLLLEPHEYILVQVENGYFPSIYNRLSKREAYFNNPKIWA